MHYGFKYLAETRRQRNEGSIKGRYTQGMYNFYGGLSPYRLSVCTNTNSFHNPHGVIIYVFFNFYFQNKFFSFPIHMLHR